jgi:hypothetical protein
MTNGFSGSLEEEEYDDAISSCSSTSLALVSLGAAGHVK